MTTLAFPAFADRQARTLGRAAFVAFGFAVLLGGVALWVPGLLWVSIPALFALAAASRLGLRAMSMRLGDRGESRVVDALSTLTGEVAVVRNWVPDAKGGDVDLVVVAPSGVWVLVIKTYSVPTRGSGHDWTIQKENGTWRPIKSPSRQLERNVRRVAKAIGIPVRGLLVFNDRLRLTTDGVPVPVVRCREVAATIADAPEQKTAAAVTDWLERIRQTAA